MISCTNRKGGTTGCSAGKKAAIMWKRKKKKKICGYVNHSLYKGDNVRDLQWESQTT